MAEKKGKDLVSNRKAFHDYEIMETFEAGISLMGTEVKVLRENHGSLLDAYVLISHNEAFLKNASIPPYTHGNIYNHQEKRTRKLLLHKREIAKLRQLTEVKGLTVIPLSIYLKNQRVKVKIAVARGKKQYDKRSTIKERDEKRTIDRLLKGERS